MRRVGNRLFDLTGFRGKTFWDWMGLLVVPLFIALATGALGFLQFQMENQRADALLDAEEERADALRDAENRRLQAQQRIEDDRVRQSVLQSYMQGMTELLLDKGLAESEPGLPIQKIARSSTIAAVRQLDAKRKGILLGFLYESNLISHSDYQFPGVGYKSPNNPIIVLRGADLSGTHLTDTNLTAADLRGANLTAADLRGANLSDAEGWGGADLRGATGWTNKQLAQAESLVGATLPNGRVIKTEEDWEEFKKQYRSE